MTDYDYDDYDDFDDCDTDEISPTEALINEAITYVEMGGDVHDHMIEILNNRLGPDYAEMVIAKLKSIVSSRGKTFEGRTTNE